MHLNLCIMLQGQRITEQGWITVLQLAFYSIMGFGLPGGLFDFALSLPHSRCLLHPPPALGMHLAACRWLPMPAAGQ